MDPLSIVGTAVSLSAIVARLARDVDLFTRQVREARREMDGVSRELGSLKSAIELLAEDMKAPGVAYPSTLGDVLVECEDVIQKLDETLKKYNQERLSTRMKYVWSGKETMNVYRSTLAAHRGALDLAIDVITLSITRQIKAGVDETRGTTNEIKEDTERILEQIAELQARLPGQYQEQDDTSTEKSNVMLRRYLDQLTEYAATVVGDEDLDPRSETFSQETENSPNIIESPPKGNGAVERGAPDGSRQNVQVDGKASEPLPESYPDTFMTMDAGEELSSVTVQNAEGLENFTWDTWLSIPEEYVREGLESKKHKEWREEVVQRMQHVPKGEISPKNGITYQEGIDYNFYNEGNTTTITANSPPLEEGGVQSQAIQIAWTRQFSLAGNYINEYVAFSSERRIRPLYLALEMQDWKWVHGLLASGAKLHEHADLMLRGNTVETVLSLACGSSLAHLKFLTERFNQMDSVSANSCRAWTIKGLIDNHPVLRYSRRSELQDKVATVVLYAVQILLKTGDPIANLGPSLHGAVAIKFEPLFRLLLQHHADPNDIYGVQGTALHMAIHFRRWKFAKLLVAAGADCFRKAEIYRSLTGGKKNLILTPIEFAAYKGTLGNLNEALGTQHKDLRPRMTKLAIALKIR